MLTSNESTFDRLISFVFSFETVFVLYLFAGFFKSDERLRWFPVDVTLFFFVLSVIAGFWVLWKRRFAVSRDGVILVLTMGVFSGWMLLSLLWAPRTQYGFDKATQFAILNVWALAGAALVTGGDRERLWRFYYAILTIAFFYAVEASRIYLPQHNVFTFPVFGTTYLSAGKVIGLGLIIAVGVFLAQGGGGKRRWLMYALSLFFFFVLLFIGARGPFLSVLVASFFILLLAKGQFQRKVAWITALIVVYAASSMVLGPSMRTMYRINVILVHELDWDLPGMDPTPTPTPTPGTLSTSTSSPRRAAQAETNMPVLTATAVPKVRLTSAPTFTPTAQAAAIPPQSTPAFTRTPTPRFTPTPTSTSPPRLTAVAAGSSAKPKRDPELTKGRTKIPNARDASNKGVDRRRVFFANAWNLWHLSPLIGAGVGSFAFYFPENYARVYPHNIILETLSELGVVGLLLIVALLAAAFYPLYRSRAWRRTLSVIALGVLIFTLLNAMVSGDLLSNRHLFTALGLLVATGDLWLSRNEGD